jgi:hypothetical protein
MLSLVLDQLFFLHLTRLHLLAAIRFSITLSHAGAHFGTASTLASAPRLSAHLRSYLRDFVLDQVM